MKRLIGILIMVAFLIAICIGEELMVGSSVSRVKEYCQSLYSLANQSETVDTAQIISLTNTTVEFWKKQEHNLCFFINYKDMSEMSNELIRMLSYAKDNVKDEYIASLSLVLYYCETFDHITGFNFQNIF